MINARILQLPLSFNASDELLKLDRELFGKAGDTVNEIRREYYAAFADFGNEPLKEAAGAWHFYYREYEALPFIRNAATDGQLVWFGKHVLGGTHRVGCPDPDSKILRALTESAERFKRLSQKAKETEGVTPKDARLYFRQFLKYPILYMQLLSEWCIACVNLTNEALPAEERKQSGCLACSYLERILDERKVLEVGEWQNWHRGEKKVDVKKLLERTKEVYKGIKT